MSRRGAEFQHRTSIFEGAYRAWSHLGRIEPNELVSRRVSDLDPLSYTIEVDSRSIAKDYRYEPLPRCGLTHPFVKVVLVRWLGSEVDNDGIKLGLETLRTWWQHRRKAQSATAVKALSSEKMRKAVDEYTRYFFKCTHCFIVTDKEQPPKTLQLRLKQFERETGSVIDIGTDADMTSCSNENALSDPSPLKLKGKCLPGNLNLPELVNSVKHKAIQMAHRGAGSRPDGPSSVSETLSNSSYGDPEMVPVVYCFGREDRQIAMSVDGITCAHCIKIVETVLKGCSGQKSPIDGLLDAVADQDLNGVLIRVDKTVNAKRIAWEAARNLSLVGYKAEIIQIKASSVQGQQTLDETIRSILDAFENLGLLTTRNVINWDAPCTCPDGGVYRNNCQRYV